MLLFWRRLAMKKQLGLTKMIKKTVTSSPYLSGVDTFGMRCKTTVCRFYLLWEIIDFVLLTLLKSFSQLFYI